MNGTWDMNALSKPPQVYPAAGFEADGVRALFYDGALYDNQPTRVFAWYGVPPHEPGDKLPAMVLVHGGGGTAFPDWVRLWNARGYAAIAMDTCGGVPCWNENPYSRDLWPRHAHSGPNGWGHFEQADLPPEAQWPHHAVAAVILANSLLRSFPDIDPERIGLTGVSWGGYLTCVAAGVDPRFRFAAPVYGCGFLGGDSVGLYDRATVDGAKLARWLKLWDPANFLGRAEMPILWVNGTNDFAFPMDSMQKSYRLPPGERLLSIRVRMPHAHGGPGEKPEEIRAAADGLCLNGAGLPRILGQGYDKGRAWLKFRPTDHVANAEFNFTRAQGHWFDRAWNTVSAELDIGAGMASAIVPADATVYFFNLFDDRGCVASAEHVEAGDARALPGR